MKNEYGLKLILCQLVMSESVYLDGSLVSPKQLPAGVLNGDTCF